MSADELRRLLDKFRRETFRRQLKPPSFDQLKDAVFVSENDYEYVAADPEAFYVDGLTAREMWRNDELFNLYIIEQTRTGDFKVFGVPMYVVRTSERHARFA